LGLLIRTPMPCPFFPARNSIPAFWSANTTASRYRSRLWIIEELIRLAKAKGDVLCATHADVVRYARPRRLRCPMTKTALVTGGAHVWRSFPPSIGPATARAKVGGSSDPRPRPRSNHPYWDVIGSDRMRMRAPLSGWVTNLLVRQGDYAVTGETAMSIVDADSFWVDGYFEETALRHIDAGDPAKVWLLGYGKVLQGHVDSVARGIVVSNAMPGKSGLASVNPIFTWVRLAQRIPVRIQIDELPPDVGMTATIEVEPSSSSPRPLRKVRRPPRLPDPNRGRRR